MRKLLDAKVLLEGVRARRCLEYGLSSMKTIKATVCLAKAYVASGKLYEASVLYKEARDAGGAAAVPEHPLFLEATAGLGKVYLKQGDFSSAQPLASHVYWNYKETFGARHIRTLAVLNDLANIYSQRGLEERARITYDEGLSGYESVYGPNHTGTLTLAFNLSLLHREKADYVVAARLAKRALEGRELVYGAFHERTLEAVANLAKKYSLQKKGIDALSILSQYAPYIASSDLEQWHKFRKLFTKLLKLAVISSAYREAVLVLSLQCVLFDQRRFIWTFVEYRQMSRDMRNSRDMLAKMYWSIHRTRDFQQKASDDLTARPALPSTTRGSRRSNWLSNSQSICKGRPHMLLCGIPSLGDSTSKTESSHSTFGQATVPTAISNLSVRSFGG